MPFTFVHTGDLHLEEDHYFGDTAHCIEWFVEDSIQQGTNLFVLDGDLTTYKQTIQERKFWVDALIRMAEHALRCCWLRAITARSLMEIFIL